MSKILQVRRGTTAANENFTGLPGEISMDTDTGTLRVHNGQTVGGIPLARADMANVNTGSFANFTPDSVSAAVWNTLFREHNLKTNIFGISDARPITQNIYIEYIFDTLPEIDLSRAVADVILVCQTPVAGYSVGDYVYAFGIGNIPCPRPIAFKYESGVKLRQFINGELIWVINKTDGTRVNITTSDWRIIFRIWGNE